LPAGNFFANNIHRANHHFTHSTKLEKTDNTTALPLDGIVYRKKPLTHVYHNTSNSLWKIQTGPNKHQYIYKKHYRAKDRIMCKFSSSSIIRPL
jgi:hypothetical protein